MKVALLTDADVFAGTEKHLLDLALALGNEPEVHATLLCPANSPLAQRAHKAGLKTMDVPSGESGLIDRTLLRILKEHLESGRFDILHAHNGRTALHAALAVVLSKRGRLVFTQHFLAPSHTARTGLKAAIFKQAHHWVNSHTHHFIAISHAVKEQMESRGDAPVDRITIIHNALATPDLSALTAAAEIKETYHLSADAPLIVCLARLEKEKDIETLVRAIGKLRDRNIAVQCVVGGEGEEREKLESLVRELGLEKSMFLPGFCDNALSLLNAGEIFVLPSHTEAFGLVLLEAMALGKPIVATNIGGPPEVVENEVSGYLVPLQDAEAMANALERLLDNPALRMEMGQKGRARFANHFQLDRLAKQTVGVYRQVQN